MTDAVPAAVLLATTVCLAGSTVTAWVPPSAEITVCAPVLVSMAITVLSTVGHVDGLDTGVHRQTARHFSNQDCDSRLGARIDHARRCRWGS
jgi:hypothetical protein